MAAMQRPLTFHNVIGVVLITLGVLFLLGSPVAYIGGQKAHSDVSKELRDQRIFFNQDMSAEPEALRPFAGQQVDTGPEIKAFAIMIKGHIARATGGLTFSEVSRAARQDENNQALQQARRIALEGSTIYGMLQNAYGWWLLGTIAMWAALGLLLSSVLLLGVGTVLLRRVPISQSAT